MNWKKTIGGFILVLLDVILLNIDMPNSDYLIFDTIKLGAGLNILEIIGVIVGVILMVIGLYEESEQRRR